MRAIALLELQILVKLSGEEGENIYLEQALREQFSSFFVITSSAHRADNDVLLDPEPQSAKMKKVKLSLRAETKSDDGSSTSSHLSDDSEGDDAPMTAAKRRPIDHTHHCPTCGRVSQCYAPGCGLPRSFVCGSCA